MSVTLSIIIPCYNGADTLREAVDSCYKQGLDIASFEIIIVDDGSTDGSKELMSTLAIEHTNIHHLFHPQNRGGGAARNTGIKAAQGKIMYCLDADNLFADNSVLPMLHYLQSNNLDGVVFHTRRFFLGQDIKHYVTYTNSITDRNLSLGDLFDNSKTLLDNFFYTKSSYDKTAGYPEHHGFDTQCFEMRYLSTGNNVRVCPDSFFYHRQDIAGGSYFERVHASGLFSVNTMLCYEDIFHLFNKETQNALLNFSMFTQNLSHDENILSFLKQRVTAGMPIFIENYEQYLVANSQTVWLEKNPNGTGSSLPEIYLALTKNESIKAQASFLKYIEIEKNLSPYLLFLNLRIINSIAGIPYAKGTATTIRQLPNLQITKRTHRLQKYPNLYKFLKRVRHRLNYIFAKQYINT